MDDACFAMHNSKWTCRCNCDSIHGCLDGSVSMSVSHTCAGRPHLPSSLLPNQACQLKDHSDISLDLQGREKDVAIFSTVRDGRKHGSIGFVADERRVNVGLTRARSSLIVIGNAKALRTDERWGNLVKQATRDGSVLCAYLVSCIQYTCLLVSCMQSCRHSLASLVAYTQSYTNSLASLVSCMQSCTNSQVPQQHVCSPYLAWQAGKAQCQRLFRYPAASTDYVAMMQLATCCGVLEQLCRGLGCTCGSFEHARDILSASIWCSC